MKIERGGDKVFTDLGHPAAVHLLKAELITRIGEIIRRRKDWDALKNGVLATRKRREKPVADPESPWKTLCKYREELVSQNLRGDMVKLL